MATLSVILLMWLASQVIGQCPLKGCTDDHQDTLSNHHWNQAMATLHSIQQSMDEVIQQIKRDSSREIANLWADVKDVRAHLQGISTCTIKMGNPVAV